MGEIHLIEYQKEVRIMKISFGSLFCVKLMDNQPLLFQSNFYSTKGILDIIPSIESHE